MMSDEPFDQFIVLRTGYGNVLDVGYGFEHDDIVAIAHAHNTSLAYERGSPEHDAAWRDVERRAKRWRKRTVASC